MHAIPPEAAMTTIDAKSVAEWIKDLGTESREEAFRRHWERCFLRLVRLAEVRLRNTNRGPADGEDIAPSAFQSFFRGCSSSRSTPTRRSRPASTAA